MRRNRRASANREKLLFLAFKDEEYANQALVLNEDLGVFSPKEAAQIEAYWAGFAKWTTRYPWWVQLLMDAGTYSPRLSAFPEGKQMLNELTSAMAPLKKEIKQVYADHGFDVEVEPYSFDNGNSYGRGTAQFWVYLRGSEDPVAYWASFSLYDDLEPFWDAGFWIGGKLEVEAGTGPGFGKDFKSTLSKRVRFLRGGIAQLDSFLDSHPDATPAGII